MMSLPNKSQKRCASCGSFQELTLYPTQPRDRAHLFCAECIQRLEQQGERLYLVFTLEYEPRATKGRLGTERLARIIHERSGGLRFASGKTDECPWKVANSPHIDSNHSKAHPPYSSTKLGFVNNPG